MLTATTSVMEWLLDSDPAIRWQVLRDLTDTSPAEVAAERSRVALEGWGRRLLDEQRSDGQWGDGVTTPFWWSNMWTLVWLRDLGLDPASPQARSAIGRVRGNVTWGAAFGNSPFFEGEVEPCINGRVLGLGAYFGERSDSLVDRLLREQLGDGGWNCEAERGSVRSSFHTTVCVLEGLLAFEQAFGATPAVTGARKRAEEYLLERHLLRRLSTGELIRDRKGQKDWRQFAFPPLWHYDVLRALDYLCEAGEQRDERMDEALAIVLERRQQDGRWLLDVRHDQTLYEDIAGSVGEPSRWITLRALRVLDWYARRDQGSKEEPAKASTSSGARSWVSSLSAFVRRSNARISLTLARLSRGTTMTHRNRSSTLWNFGFVPAGLMRVVGYRACFTSLLLSSLWFAACSREDDQIKVYRLAKPSGESEPMEKDAIASTNGPVKSTLERMPPPIANVPTPPNWQPQALSEMRQASFLVKGDNGAVADVSFVKLGPAAGSVLDNVNRWLGQLGQPPVTEEKLAGMIQKLPTPQGEVDIVDLSGKPQDGDANKDGRIVGAIASDEGTSFFKLRGNPDLVGAEKEKFLKWVVAMRSGASSESAAMPQLAAAPMADKPQIKWDVPSDWSPAPASAMRYASFAASSDSGGKIDISVVTFPGDGGDDLGNINRWRQQLGLPPAEANASKIVPLKTEQTTFSTIDITGANGRTVAAWTRKDGRAWFFKLTGSSDGVDKEKSNFVKFVQSVRF